MLLNDFYTVHELQPSESSLSCIVVFDQQHEIFKSQRQQASVPEDVLVEMVRELLERELDKKLSPENNRLVKNLKPVTPDIDPEIHISWKGKGEGYEVNASFKKDADLFRLSGNFVIS